MGSHKSILFVDYENVGKVDVNAIPPDVHVPFFFGASQKSVPTEARARTLWTSTSPSI
jgi:hypothetical protein